MFFLFSAVFSVLVASAADAVCGEESVEVGGGCSFYTETPSIPAGPWGTTGNLYIGFRNKGGQEAYFNGQIDDVLIYDRALAQAEILEIYSSQSECSSIDDCASIECMNLVACDPPQTGGYDYYNPMGCGYNHLTSGTGCDDGLYCTVNGTSTCDGAGSCTGGTALDCSDSVACTDDSCNESTDSCDNIENDDNCDPEDMCDELQGCIPDPCYGITQCGDYANSLNCSANNCGVAYPGCVWNSSSGVCEEASAMEYEGFGTATGGAEDCGGYETYNVTSLANSGAGTLRDAVSQDCRYIVFYVGGTIYLTGSLYIQSSYLTIDGSTAPSPGITISVHPGGFFQILGEAHDIIMNNLRADGHGTSDDVGGMDGMYGSGPVYNVIIDHCTFTSAGDGVFDTRGSIENVTYSWNLFKYTDFMGCFGDPCYRRGISLHHNVMAHGGMRMPKIDNEEGSPTNNFDLVNNVAYGWGTYDPGSVAGLQLENYGWPFELHVTNNWYEDLLGYESSAIVMRGHGHQIDFEGNVFPSAETDDVDTGISPPSIGSWAQVTTYDTNTIGDAVVPCVGTYYRTQEEQNLLDEISQAVGGQGGFCHQTSSCTDDSGCNSTGSFCDGDVPYTCSLGGDGCLDRVNGTDCGAQYDCIEGTCVVSSGCTAGDPPGSGSWDIVADNTCGNTDLTVHDRLTVTDSQLTLQYLTANVTGNVLQLDDSRLVLHDSAIEFG